MSEHVLQQVSVIGCNRHLGQNDQPHHVELGRVFVFGRRQGFHRGAGSAQTSRSQLDHAVDPGPDVEHHSVTFTSGALDTGGDLRGSLLHRPTSANKVRVVIHRQ